jgi:tetratricopeptide (TPR) repeat protein
MKKFLGILAIMLPILCSAQTVQKGRVLEKDSHGKPLANTQIVLKDAVPTSSGTDGKYQLVFKSKTPGEMVFVVSINKAGYELVNEPQVKDWILSDMKDFDIILCKEGLLKQSKENFYKVGKSRYQAEYNRKFSEIEALKQANKLDETECNKKLKEIYDERQKAFELLEYYTDLFSRINKDDLSDLELRAYQLSAQGKIDEAIQVYENEKLLTKFVGYDSLRKQAKEDMESMVPSLRRYAELCAFAGGKENYEKAGKCYEAIALSDTSNYNYVVSVAKFLGDQKQFSKSVKWYLTALQLVRNDAERALILDAMACQQIEIDQYETAELNLTKALSLRRILAEKSSDVYASDVATTLNNMAYFHSVVEQYEKSESNYIEALSIRRTLAEKNPGIYSSDLAMTLNDLAYLQSVINQYEKSESNYIEALSIRRTLVEKNPEIYTSDVAGTLNDLAFLQQAMNQFEKSELNYTEALDIRRALAENNPDVYNSDVANTLNNLADLNHSMNNYEKAESNFTEALGIYRALAERNPDVYNSDVARTLNNLADLQRDMNQYEKSELNLIEALSIRRTLAMKYPEVYTYDVAVTLNNLAFLQKTMNKNEQAELNYMETLSKLRILAEKNPNVFLPSVATALDNMANLQQKMKQYEKAESNFTEALKIRRELADKNPEVYSWSVAATLNNLATLQKDMDQYEKSESNYIEALYRLKALAQKNPEVYNSFVGTTLNNLSWLQYKTNLSEAIKNTQEAIDIYALLDSSNSNVKAQLSIFKTRMARYRVFAGQFKEAEELARQAIEIDNTLKSAQKNLAFALLFQGKYEDALKIFTELNVDEGMKKQIMTDLDELEHAGITHPDVEKIRKLLSD